MLSDEADHIFDALFARYERALCSYLVRLNGDPARAQELTQETFIRAYRALRRGEEWSNPRAWLYRVASRLATDDHRRRKLLEWLPLLGTEPDPVPSIERVVGKWLDVQAALDKLPPIYRIPLVLYTCEGHTTAEIAETLGLSISAVKMRLSRARTKFRRAYEQEQDQ